MTNCDILISNGSHQIHLLPLSESLFKDGFSVRLITFLHPYRFLKPLLRKLPSSKAQRLLNKSLSIDDNLVDSCLLAQILTLFADYICHKTTQKMTSRLHYWAAYYYSLKASRLRTRYKPIIYHFRSGYGILSLDKPISSNSFAVCDHSYGYPSLSDFMIHHGGDYPANASILNSPRTNSLASCIESDLKKADYSIVNSHFVKDNLVFVGHRPSRVFVAYPGIENQFLEHITQYEHSVRRSKSLLYAGSWDIRKGVQDLAMALEIAQSPCTIVGPSTADIANLTPQLMNSALVHLTGYLNWHALAKQMLAHRIFVFPSLSEGSARVVSMALACGCFVITTKNTGSIVTHGHNGFIVKPASPSDLATAIVAALKLDDSKLKKISKSSMHLMCSQFTQAQYAKRISEIYNSIMTGCSDQFLDDPRIPVHSK